jgi:hypothetical protein
MTSPHARPPGDELGGRIREVFHRTREPAPPFDAAATVARAAERGSGPRTLAWALSMAASFALGAAAASLWRAEPPPPAPAVAAPFALPPAVAERLTPSMREELESIVLREANRMSWEREAKVASRPRPIY